MGHRYGVICAQCGHKFNVSEGGGFVFHLLHCDRCGRDRSVPFEEIGGPHLRYLKGLPGPYSMATSDHDRHVQENYPGEPLSEEEYHGIVGKIAGTCRCGGKFTFDAPPRCPECRSTDLKEDPEAGGVLYD